MIEENKLNTLSQRLKFILKELNLSQTELARRINVKPQVIQYLCTSQSQKSKFTADIADALNVDFSWLATGKGNKPTNLESKKNKNFIPLLTYEQVRAWQNSKMEINLSHVQKWITPSDKNTNSFALELNDRSMAPRFDLNTIVIIQSITPEEILDLNPFVLVYLKSEDFIIFRQLEVLNDIKYLRAINKNLHKDIILTKEDVIIGICKEARWSLL